jgi:hypothetical protein
MTDLDRPYAGILTLSLWGLRPFSMSLACPPRLYLQVDVGVLVGFDKEEHKGAHLPTRDRLEREVGAAQVGGGAHAGVAFPLPQVGGTLRAAGRHPRSVPPSRLFVDLLQLSEVRVLQGTLRTVRGFRTCARVSVGSEA